MPIYEYQCKRCGKIFERFQKLNDREEIVKCPNCGSKEIERILSCFSYKGNVTSSSSCGSSGSSGFS